MTNQNLITDLQQIEISSTFLQKTKDEWNRFIEGKPVNTHVIPPEIYHSWKRSRSFGVSPWVLSQYKMDDSRKKELTNFRHLMNSYKPFFEKVTEFINHDQFQSIFYDVNIICDHVVDSAGTVIYPQDFLGFDCSEKIVGTTSASLALLEDRPKVVLQYQHYCEIFHDYHCASAPLHNEKKEQIGIFNIQYFDIKKTAQAYRLAEFLAGLFDSLVMLGSKEREKHIEQMIDILPYATAVLSEENSVRYYNHKLLDLFKVKNKHDLEQVLKTYIPKSGTGCCFDKKKISLEIEGKHVNTYVTCHEIKDKTFGKTKKLVQWVEDCRLNESKTKEDLTSSLFTFDQIMGKNTAMGEAKDIAKNVAKTSVPILLFGENGTGKEMFAQAIHSASPRKDKPFVAINCGALPAELVESELFGYEGGSFTGALKEGKMGKIEAANGGTLFLDEIESMPLRHQIKLLRVLSTGTIQKVGGTKEIPVDFRLISATKKDLLKEADLGLFREDLYYRMSTFIIKLPTLRERKEDIPVLAQSFALRYSDKYRLSNIKIDTEFIEALIQYPWRGNVRELENVIERAVVIAGDGPLLTLKHLPEKIQEYYKDTCIHDLVQNAIEKKESKTGLLAYAEKLVIDSVLKSVGGNVSIAADRLGITRRTLYNKLHEYEQSLTMTMN